MKKRYVIAVTAAAFLTCSGASTVMADPDPYSLRQVTWLVQKAPQGGAPWTIILPDPDGGAAFGKLEYFNYGEEFCFDFKGYDFDDGVMPVPAEDEYALIYYVDPGPGPWTVSPDVYVLGISSGPYQPPPGKGAGAAKKPLPAKQPVPAPQPVPADGNGKGLEGVDFKIDGCCLVGQIPTEDDVNYPNGGKIWLVPSAYLANPVACEWTTMEGWGLDILFETSLVTYGFVDDE